MILEAFNFWSKLLQLLLLICKLGFSQYFCVLYHPVLNGMLVIKFSNLICRGFISGKFFVEQLCPFLKCLINLFTKCNWTANMIDLLLREMYEAMMGFFDIALDVSTHFVKPGARARHILQILLTNFLDTRCTASNNLCNFMI